MFVFGNIIIMLSFSKLVDCWEFDLLFSFSINIYSIYLYKESNTINETFNFVKSFEIVSLISSNTNIIKYRKCVDCVNSVASITLKKLVKNNKII